MSKVLIIGAAPAVGASAMAELVKQLGGEFQSGALLEVTSFAPFNLSLPEIGLMCRPYAVERVILRDLQALHSAMHSAMQIAQLNKVERLVSVRVLSGEAEQADDGPAEQGGQADDDTAKGDDAQEGEEPGQAEQGGQAAKAKPATGSRGKAK